MCYIYKNVYIPPWPDDGGVSIGGALYMYYKVSKKQAKQTHLRHSFYGPGYKKSEI